MALVIAMVMVLATMVIPASAAAPEDGSITVNSPVVGATYNVYKVFDMKELNVMWDTHGMIPEEYHSASNFHTEEVTANIEKLFYEKADVLICQNSEERDHYINKYGKRDMKYIVCPSERSVMEFENLIK